MAHLADGGAAHPGITRCAVANCAQEKADRSHGQGILPVRPHRHESSTARWRRGAATSNPQSIRRALINVSGGMSTLPIDFMRFLPAFCFSSSLRLRVMSPP